MALQFRAGQILTADDLMAIQQHIVIQGADQEVVSSTTPVDSSIAIEVEANARYIFQTRLSYGSSTAGGMRVTWSGPSGSAMGRYIQAATAGTVADSADIVTRVRAMGTQQVVGGGLAFAFYEEEGDVRTAGTPGTMLLSFAQGTSDASPTILRADSHVRYFRIE